MVADHGLHVGAVERCAVQFLKSVEQGSVFRVDILRQLDALALGDRLQLLAGFGVVVDHVLAEPFHLVVFCSLGREPAERHFSHSAFRRVNHELDVFGS